jgi:hypothetical protein
MEYEKYFIIIGNQNAITYREIFPLPVCMEFTANLSAILTFDGASRK